RLADELSRIAPAECLVAERDEPAWGDALCAAGTKTLTPRPDWTFDPPAARDALFHQFGVATLAGFGFERDDTPGATAAGALVLYLKETLKAQLGHLRAVRPFRPDQYLVLDEVTRRSLELTRTLRDGGRDGSLLSVLDRTVTAMGARLLQEWIVAPLAEREGIEARLDAVGELKAEHGLRGELRSSLGEAFDLQRL